MCESAGIAQLILFPEPCLNVGRIKKKTSAKPEVILRQIRTKTYAKPEVILHRINK